MIIRALVAAATLIGIVLSFSPARAAIVTWDLSTPAGLLGNTQTYSQNAIPITAAGFTSNSFAAPTKLYGKNDPGDEKGLGLNNDQSGDHEVSGSNLIRIDFTNARNAGITGFSFSMNSTTSGEQWDVFGSNSPTSGFISLLVGSDEQVHQLAGSGAAFKYYYFGVVSSNQNNDHHQNGFFQFQQDNDNNSPNVLLHTVSGVSSVPEPSTWAMMILGFASVGFMAYRRQRPGLPSLN
jgi:hypothetical protein